MKMKKKPSKPMVIATSFALSGLLAFGGSYWMVQEHKKDVQIELSKRDTRISNLMVELKKENNIITSRDNDIKSLQNVTQQQNSQLQELQANNSKLQQDNARIQQENDALKKTLKTYQDRSESPSSGSVAGGRSLSIVVTAYTNDPSENGGTYGGRVVTRTGYDITNTIYYQGYRIIATDPSIIPLNSIVRITLANGSSFEAISLDTGGAIRGNIIDYLVGSDSEARQFGRQHATITVLREGKG